MRKSETDHTQAPGIGQTRSTMPDSPTTGDVPCGRSQQNRPGASSGGPGAGSRGAVVRHVSHVTDRVWRLGSISRNPVDLPSWRYNDRLTPSLAAPRPEAYSTRPGPWSPSRGPDL